MKRMTALLLAAVLLLLPACGEVQRTAAGTGEDDLETADELYLGSWYDFEGLHSSLSITRAGDNREYDIRVDWLEGIQRNAWQMTASYDPDTGALSYTDGVKFRGESGEGASDRWKVLWRDGTGTLTCEDGTLYWEDSRNSGGDWHFARYQTAAYDRLDPEGSYRGADGASSLTIRSTGGETYQVQMELPGLLTVDSPGRFENNVFSFPATDPNGAALTAVVTKDGKDVLVTVTHSAWEELPVGTVFSFLRPLPQLTAEEFRQLFAQYTSYNANERGAEAWEAEAAVALVRFAQDHFLAYTDRNETHKVARAGYLALSPEEMGGFDYNVYHGLYQLVEQAFAEYDTVRARFEAVGLGEEMEKLVEAPGGYAHWEEMRVHLFGISLERL